MSDNLRQRIEHAAGFFATFGDDPIDELAATVLRNCSANFDLFEAAPALLEALEGLLDALPSATTHPAIKQARAAIAKAKGEA